MRNKSLPLAKRMYVDPKVTFTELINSIIDNKIEELVNNANKVNTATSPHYKKEQEIK